MSQAATEVPFCLVFIGSLSPRSLQLHEGSGYIFVEQRSGDLGVFQAK